MKARQWGNPTKWALTFQQWEEGMKHVVTTAKYQELKKDMRTFSMYDMRDHFIIPWTKGTGCGAAVLMNQQQEVPDATLMLSHAWKEDIEECMQAMGMWADERKLLKSDVWVWSCVFANYQCEDACGPTIAQQLEKDPFEAVIRSDAVKEMCAIHTTQEDLYNRLWCVLEIAEAITRKLQVSSAMSKEYMDRVQRRISYFFDKGFDHEVCMRAAGVSCDTVKAQCRREDEEMLCGKILDAHEDFRHLDAVINKFRLDSLPEGVAIMVEAAKSRVKNPLILQDALESLSDKARNELVTANLAKRLQEDDRISVRYAVLRALQEVGVKGNSTAVDEVRKLLRNCERDVRQLAMFTLAILADEHDHATRDEIRRCRLEIDMEDAFVQLGIPRPHERAPEARSQLAYHRHG